MIFLEANYARIYQTGIHQILSRSGTTMDADHGFDLRFFVMFIRKVAIATNLGTKVAYPIFIRHTGAF